jgi:hypothetical protein
MQTKRMKNEETLHTNDAKNARYTKRIHEANLRYTNERTIWRAQANEPGSFVIG